MWSRLFVKLSVVAGAVWLAGCGGPVEDIGAAPETPGVPKVAQTEPLADEGSVSAQQLPLISYYDQGPFSDLITSVGPDLNNDWIEDKGCTSYLNGDLATYGSHELDLCRYNCEGQGVGKCVWRGSYYACYGPTSVCRQRSVCRHFDGECTGSTWPWNPKPRARTVTVDFTNPSLPDQSASATDWNGFPWVVVCGIVNVDANGNFIGTAAVESPSYTGTSYCLW